MKVKKISRVVIGCLQAVIVSVSISATAYAQQCSLVPSDRAHIDDLQRSRLLQGMKFSELEQDLTKLHKKHLASDGKDLYTLRKLYDLQKHIDNDGKLLRMWVDEEPQSFFVQITTGLVYFNKAFSARGQKAASDVSKDQWNNAKKVSEEAVAHLQKAMELDSRSALPSAFMIGLAAMNGKAAGHTAEEWLQVANKTDPENIAARINAISYLSPRWGGSFELLEQMIVDAKKSLPKDTVHYLEYNLVLEKASHYEVIEGNQSKAHDLYKEAKSMCENSGTAQVGILRTY